MSRFRSLEYLLPLLAILAAGCEHTERHSTKRLVFNISAHSGDSLFLAGQSPGSTEYLIQTAGKAFFSSGDEVPPDSEFIPVRLIITIKQAGSGDLISTLKDRFGYHVETGITLNGGNIISNHTNLASFLPPKESDSMYVYAIRGEGIVTRGDHIFENVSGLFFEESTFQFSDTTGIQDVVEINCRYELTVDF
ncbi:MAG: hypothetical protein V1794_10800 [Candidatus Glassbacteria bacterium]